MVSKRSRWAVPVLVAGLAAFGVPVMGQEHPKEHPSGKQEHPKEGKAAEHPKGEAHQVTTDELALAITDYVNKESGKSGGKFMVKDSVDKKDLSLTLSKIHKDKLSQVGKDEYFLCADFTNTDGVVYDLDVFMKGPNAQSLKTTEVTVHKKNGVERYTWAEEGGTWKKVATGGGEHPKDAAKKEHPKGGEHPKP